MDTNEDRFKTELSDKPESWTWSGIKKFREENMLRSLPLQFIVIAFYLVLIECLFTVVIQLYFHDWFSKWTEGFLNAAVVTLILTPIVYTLIIKRDRTLLKQHQEALEKEVYYQQLTGKLARAFGMAETESDIVRVFERVVAKIIPNAPVELLLADSSNAHLRVASSSMNGRNKQSGDKEGDSVEEKRRDGTDPGFKYSAMCHVHSPQACLATRLGKSHIFTDSLDLDACPLLIDRSERTIAAVCEPINVAGKTIGIIHSDMEPDCPDLDFISTVFPLISKHLGNRLGLIRALNTANLAAMTDPLTGVLNRRSLEDRCAAYLTAGRKLSVVVTDIDRFKNLNDTYSHAVGDRALKEFSRTLQKICRKDDLVARLGGEEFCIVLLDVSAKDARAILDRVRTQLPVVLAQAGLPEFTASFGVADTDFGDNLESLIKIADDYMYEAKKAGRNTIVIAADKSKPKFQPQIA